MISGRGRALGLTAALAAVTILVGARKTMDIKLQPLEIEDAASLTRVQLVDQSGLHLLAASGHHVSILGNLRGPIDSKPAFEVTSGFEQSKWEAQALPVGGHFSWIYTKAGSAINLLMARTTGEAEGTRVHKEPFAVYVEPHYVRGQRSEGLVTAIRLEDGQARVVLFDRRTVAGAAPSREAGHGRIAITDAQLLRDSSGFWLLLLVPANDSATNPQPRKTGTGTRMPGLVEATRLDRTLKVLGSPIRLFGGLPVYEFDAALASDQRVVIFATTAAGMVAASGVPTHELLFKETPVQPALASPALLVEQDSAHMAAISDLGGNRATVVYGATRLGR